MSDRWAISGVDLHLDLDLRRPRVGLEHALREAVRTGRLVPGTRLPASRTLAADLRIARNTVAEAYAQLVAEGWLTARQGSGTRVAERAPVIVTDRPPAVRPTQSRPARFDLRAGAPDVAAFPRAAWLGAARRALAAAPHSAFGYEEPRGLAPLRRSLAAYLSRVRGVRVDAERIVVTAGFTQGLRLLAEVLAADGLTTVAVEAYGHEAHRRVLRAAGVEVAVVTVDSSGAQIEALAESDVRTVVLTPAHQFPLGAVLASGRRQAAIRWANGVDGFVVEDDYDGEFRYDRQPVGAMQALDPERVVYAGSVSKTLAPGIRLGWLVLPAVLLDDVVAAKTRTDAGSSAVDQLTLAHLMDSGEYDRIVRRARLVYRRRRDWLVEALSQHVPGSQVTGIAAGLHALLELPTGRTEVEVISAAATRGLRVEGLRTFAAGPHAGPEALVVGYSRPAEHAYSGALARLVATLTAS